MPPKLPEGLQAGCLQADCKLSTGHTFVDEDWFVSGNQVLRVPKEVVSVDVFKLSNLLFLVGECLKSSVSQAKPTLGQG